MDKSLLSEQAQSNLVELATYLKSHHKAWVKANTSGGKDELVGFDLWNFFHPSSENEEHKCGSTACAIGHFAVMRGLACRSDGVIEENGRLIDWFDFAHKYIGIKYTDATEALWAWLFSD